jgi:hypothetical protein
MTRRGDPTCPVVGTPCLYVRDDFLIELARVHAREDGRPSLKPCRRCGDRSRIALGGSTLCQMCKVGHATESDHVRRSGSGPAVVRVDTNVNWIGQESERIWKEIERDDLCSGCTFGYGRLLGTVLSRMEVDP